VHLFLLSGAFLPHPSAFLGKAMMMLWKSQTSPSSECLALALGEQRCVSRALAAIGVNSLRLSELCSVCRGSKFTTGVNSLVGVGSGLSSRFLWMPQVTVSIQGASLDAEGF
jgi:hypothetical protein